MDGVGWMRRTGKRAISAGDGWALKSMAFIVEAAGGTGGLGRR